MPTAITNIVCASDHAVATVPDGEGWYYRFNSKDRSWTKHRAKDPTDSETSLLEDMDELLQEILSVIEGPEGDATHPVGDVDRDGLILMATKIREVLGMDPS